MIESIMSLSFLAISSSWLAGCHIIHRAGFKFLTSPKYHITKYDPLLEAAMHAGQPAIFSFFLQLRSTADDDDDALSAIGGLEDTLVMALESDDGYPNGNCQVLMDALVIRGRQLMELVEAHATHTLLSPCLRDPTKFKSCSSIRGKTRPVCTWIFETWLVKCLPLSQSLCGTLDFYSRYGLQCWFSGR